MAGGVRREAGHQHSLLIACLVLDGALSAELRSAGAGTLLFLD